MTIHLSFYRRDTKTVARELLGKKLVRVHGKKRLSGIITEVEAYLGTKDRACHTFGGRRTSRTETMYCVGGHAYIYLIYGIYNCFNVVTEQEGVPEAVLIRSLEPIEGVAAMQDFRRRLKLTELTTGPGKLAQALQLTRELNGIKLNSEQLFLEEGIEVTRSQIIKKPRIGVDYAATHAAWPLRFYLANSRYISKK